jgi:hypothetical protein
MGIVTVEMVPFLLQSWSTDVLECALPELSDNKYVLCWM